MSAKTPTAWKSSWPSSVRDAVIDGARYYYQQMSDPYPVSDVAMDRAVEWANREIDARQREIYEEATPRWIKRWESGQFEIDMRKAIEETYRRLRRAERGSSPRAGAAKKRPAQLDAEIAQAIGARRR